VSAVERFAQAIPLNMQEIFLWYFEQKGIDNPERFLGVNDNMNPTPNPLPQGAGALSTAPTTGAESMQPENELSQGLPPQNLPQQNLPPHQILLRRKNDKIH